jgi:hypothetical protein
VQQFGELLGQLLRGEKFNLSFQQTGLCIYFVEALSISISDEQLQLIY